MSGMLSWQPFIDAFSYSLSEEKQNNAYRAKEGRKNILEIKKELATIRKALNALIEVGDCSSVCDLDLRLVKVNSLILDLIGLLLEGRDKMNALSFTCLRSFNMLYEHDGNLDKDQLAKCLESLQSDIERKLAKLQEK